MHGHIIGSVFSSLFFIFFLFIYFLFIYFFFFLKSFFSIAQGKGVVGWCDGAG